MPRALPCGSIAGPLFGAPLTLLGMYIEVVRWLCRRLVILDHGARWIGCARCMGDAVMIRGLEVGLPTFWEVDRCASRHVLDFHRVFSKRDICIALITPSRPHRVLENPVLLSLLSCAPADKHYCMRHAFEGIQGGL